MLHGRKVSNEASHFFSDQQARSCGVHRLAEREHAEDDDKDAPFDRGIGVLCLHTTGEQDESDSQAYGCNDWH